jgi:hypothetical protein
MKNLALALGASSFFILAFFYLGIGSGSIPSLTSWLINIILLFVIYEVIDYVFDRKR